MGILLFLTWKLLNISYSVLISFSMCMLANRTKGMCKKKKKNLHNRDLNSKVEYVSIKWNTNNIIPLSHINRKIIECIDNGTFSRCNNFCPEWIREKQNRKERRRRMKKIAARCFVYYVKQNRDIIWSFNFWIVVNFNTYFNCLTSIFRRTVNSVLGYNFFFFQMGFQIQ